MAKVKYAFSNKVTQLVDVLCVHSDKFHLTRVQFIGLFILVVIKVDLRGLIQVAGAFERNVEYNSFLCHIEHFSNDYELDFQFITRLIVSLENIED